MRTEEENNEWKAEAPYLASLPKENPFLVPEQYFDKLPGTISNSLYAKKLKEEITASGFIVPDQYFNSLAERIQTETIQLITAVFPASTGFTTPDLYFQKLQSSILAKTITAAVVPETIVTPLPARKESRIIRLWHSNLLKYASAACFVLVTAFGFYLNHQDFSKDTTTSVDMANEQMLYDIDEQDIIDHIEGNTAEDKKITPSDADMENYILNNYSQNDLSSDYN